MKYPIAYIACLILSGCRINSDTPPQNEKTIEPKKLEIGMVVDSLNGVYVFYNGEIGHIGQRNTKNGYNIGLTFQCVEFVKRYYYEYFHHKMPDSYGNAKDFFDPNVKDGKLNAKRGLLQFSNPSKSKPKINDLLIMDKTSSNPYGHVAIVSNVNNDEMEIIQQNPGPTAPSRARFAVFRTGNKYLVGNARILGWLRMKE